MCPSVALIQHLHFSLDSSFFLCIFFIFFIFILPFSRILTKLSLTFPLSLSLTLYLGFIFSFSQFLSFSTPPSSSATRLLPSCKRTHARTHLRVNTHTHTYVNTHTRTYIRIHMHSSPGLASILHNLSLYFFLARIHPPLVPVSSAFSFGYPYIILSLSLSLPLSLSLSYQGITHFWNAYISFLLSFGSVTSPSL